MSTGGKRAKPVAIPGATDKVFNKLGYFKRQTDDWGDAFVLRVQEVATDTYMSVESERATDMRVTDTSNGTSTDTYMSVATSWTLNTKASRQSSVCLSKYPSLLKTSSVAPGIATDFALFPPVYTYASLCFYFFHD